MSSASWIDFGIRTTTVPGLVVRSGRRADRRGHDFRRRTTLRRHAGDEHHLEATQRTCPQSPSGYGSAGGLRGAAGMSHGSHLMLARVSGSGLPMPLAATSPSSTGFQPVCLPGSYLAHGIIACMCDSRRGAAGSEARAEAGETCERDVAPKRLSRELTRPAGAEHVAGRLRWPSNAKKNMPTGPYVKIPDRYRHPDQSGLSLTI